MVKLRPSLALLLLAGSLAAQTVPAEKEGPALYGDGGGRLWKWQSGEKTWLTPEGRNFVLGGLRGESLWGWSLEGDRARFFTLELPKKDKADAKAKDAKPKPPASPVVDAQSFLPPDLADRVGDRKLLLWGAENSPRYEVWQGGEKLLSRAWDDGRSAYALSVGPESGWLIVGRLASGEPWLELSGRTVSAPEGWRGRLTVALWVAEKQDEKAEAKVVSGAKPVKDAKPLPPVVHPWAAGWGAPGTELPRALFWGPGGWTEQDSETAPAGGTFPLLGAPVDGALSLAGWQSDEGSGVLRPWFWDGETTVLPGGAADGQPQAFSLGGKGGAVMIVRHQAAPWFTFEDGHESTPLEGLGAEDRVVAVEAEAESKTSP